MTTTGNGGNEQNRAQLMELFHEALALDPADRETFVRTALPESPEMVQRLRDLLRADRAGHPLLDRGLGAAAGDVLHGTTPAYDRIGPYRIVEELGRGGMAVVYLAERDDIGSSAAIKILRDAALSTERRARFHQEQRTLARLVHPRVAQLYDADVLPDGTPYIVMEYVEGLPLDVYCARERLGIHDRLRLFRRVCEGVRFAHGRAVVHRDLKPSNIMVDRGGEPKLLDFGISKILDDVDPRDRVTRTGTFVHTPAYAAPEQLVGGQIGTYTDVYALGVILYELLSGSAPFALESLTPARAEQVVSTTSPPPPSARVRAAADEDRPSSPPDAVALPSFAWRDLDVLCAMAMHRDVERRYASAEALSRDIDHFLAGEPLEARPDDWPYRAATFARRNRRGLAAAVALLVSIFAGTAYATSRLAQARDTAVAEAERARRVVDFTTDLFRGWDEVAGPSNALTVDDLLDRGVRQAALLGTDPVVQSEMYLTLGSIHGQLGRYESADSLLTRALALGRVSPSDAVSEADALVALGELEVARGDYANAEELLDRALASYRAARPRDEVAVAGALTALGTAVEGLGDYDRSTELIDEAIAMLESREGVSRELSAALSALAATQFYAGALDASDSLNLRALSIDRALHGDEHPSVAHSLVNLGATEVQRGRYGEAEDEFREAARIFERYYGPDHPETASALRLLGNALLYQGRLAEAEIPLERALAIQENTLPPGHPRLANTLGDLAYIRLEGGRHDEALEMYSRIVGIYRAANGDDHYFVAIGMSNHANALMVSGRLAASEVMFRQVVERFSAARGPDHVDTGIARIKLGRVLVDLEVLDEAEAELLAGHAIVSAQTDPGVSWLRSARELLISLYETTGRSEMAGPFRAEQASVASEGR